MTKIYSGITDLDNLIDSLYAGDNVVWEVEAGTSPELFVHEFHTAILFREPECNIYQF